MLELMWQLKSEAQWLILMLTVLLALWRGAGPERQVAGTFLTMFFVDRLYHAVFEGGRFYLRVDVGHILIDLVVLGAFIAIALRANRVYPIWLASLQLMTLVSHIVRALSPAIINGVYAILMFAPSYLEVLTFGLGVGLHIRRQRKYGPYRSWRHS